MTSDSKQESDTGSELNENEYDNVNITSSSIVSC